MDRKIVLGLILFAVIFLGIVIYEDGIVGNLLNPIGKTGTYNVWGTGDGKDYFFKLVNGPLNETELDGNQNGLFDVVNGVCHHCAPGYENYYITLNSAQSPQNFYKTCVHEVCHTIYSNETRDEQDDRCYALQEYQKYPQCDILMQDIGVDISG